jgi:glutaminyl-peptide cyclotransferase
MNNLSLRKHISILKRIFTIGLSLTLLVFSISCGSDDAGKDKKAKRGTYWKSPDGKGKYFHGDTIMLQVADREEKGIDSVVYAIENKVIGRQLGDQPFQWNTSEDKMGPRLISAKVYQGGTMKKMSGKLTLLSSERPKFYGYSVVNKYPHKANAYTQGLEFDGDVLFESTGQYGKSSIRKVDLKTGEVLQERIMDKNRFGEGLTIFKDQLIQLTWRSMMGYVYKKDDFEYVKSFPYGKSKEGWGLCNDGNYLYKSDGTYRIYKLDPETYEELDYIQVTSNKSVFENINELEWVNGEIWANVYTKDYILRIDPSTGGVIGVIQLGGLLADSEKVNADVLNGIAYHAENDKIYITGKYWPSLFEIKLKAR